MEKSKDLFLKISEQDYMAIPEDIRSSHLTAKIYSTSINDFDVLMQHPEYETAYKKHKAVKKELEDITFKIREERRFGKC